MSLRSSFVRNPDYQSGINEITPSVTKPNVEHRTSGKKFENFSCHSEVDVSRINSASF